ncbi:MAG: diguanylate cyclase [Actinobacteria bacterium]|nr:diguanylate cyclase [Actinomycetota bacterium]
MVKKTKNKQTGALDGKNKKIILDGEESYFDELMDNIPDSIYFKDRDSKFVRINKACAEKFGLKNPEDAIGKTDFDFFITENAQPTYDDDQNIMKTGKKTVSIVKKEIFRDKPDRWVTSTKIPRYDRDGNIIGLFGITRDITETTIMDNKLEKEISFVDALMQGMPDSIYFKDRDSKFVRINKACADKMGLDSPDDAVGKTDYDFFGKDMAKIAYDDEQNIIKTGKHIVDLSYRETYKDKADRWMAITKMPWYDRGGNIIGIIGMARDITDKQKAEEEIKYLSFHDVLTGLYNRAFFDEELKRLNTERQLPIAIVMGDVNGLKLINDAYGHARGDVLLKRISDILRENFRGEDIISRWGGDEFISILPKTSVENAKRIVKRIGEMCRQKSTAEIPLSISFGIAVKKNKPECIEDIIKKSEDRMYKNKIAENKPIYEKILQSLKENLKKGDYISETRTKKMEDYALCIGKKLNLSDVKLGELSLLLNLHNIGKLALADEIVSKPGRLTNNEWKIIKKLPEVGYRIAESSPGLKSIAESILSHHEWYNGQGYPRGTKGEEIPVLSRISFLINSYEAMTRDRPYRKKKTKEEAMGEIKKCCGTQFDPGITKFFLEILKEEEK